MLNFRYIYWLKRAFPLIIFLFCIFSVKPILSQEIFENKTGSFLPEEDKKTELLNKSKKSKIITGINVNGTLNHNPEVILHTLSLKKGDILSSKKLRNDIDKLYKLGFFYDIKVEVLESDKELTLTFIIKENPVLHNIEFIGNEHISRKELEEELAKMPAEEKIQLGIGYSKGKELPVQNYIIDFYRTKGFPYVTVKSETELDEKLNRIVLRFLIDEGSQKEVSIKKISFKGNNAFSAYRLRRQMETKSYFPIFEDGYYKDAIFKGDLKRIIDFYKEHGYANAKIIDDKIEFNKKNKMLITIEIFEGPKYNYGDVEIKGSSSLSLLEISSELTIKKGNLFNQKEIDTNVNSIMSKYGEKGYIYSRVTPEQTINEENKTVSIIFRIVENTEMHLNEIKFFGNTVTKDKVIRREILVYPGDIFNTKRIRRSIQRIYNLGFFQDINIDTEPGNKDDNLNLKINLKEKPTGQANFGASYSDVDGLVGQISLSKDNLFGYGQRIDLSWQFGKNLQDYEFSFTDPYILDTKFLLGFNVFNTIRSRIGYDYYGEKDQNGNVEIVKLRNAYEYRKVGGGLKIGRAISENLHLSLNYNYENGEYRSVGDNPLPSDVIVGKNLTRSLTYVLKYDNRDNVFNPTTGVKYVLSWEKAGGFLSGDNNYNKFIVDSFFYQKTFSKFVLMLHMQMGTVDSYHPSDDVPPIEKFSIGGGSTVRGYAERGIADRKKREFYLNLEHKYPLEENVNFVMFLDSGNAWDNTEEIRTKDLKSGMGLGFHLETPIGPLRLDYGWGLNLEPGDEKGRFHFNLGWGFY